jgi:hypothetical protein
MWPVHVDYVVKMDTIEELARMSRIGQLELQIGLDPMWPYYHENEKGPMLIKINLKMMLKVMTVMIVYLWRIAER